MRLILQIFILTVTSILLAGCLSAVKVTPDKTYMISAVPSDIVSKSDDAKTLMVLRPESVPVYDTTQMAYSKCPYQIEYYAKNQWAETPEQMLQPLIIKTLQNTHHFHAVVAPPFVGNYEYSLNTQIIELQQDYTAYCHPMLRLKIRAQLNDMTANTVLATKDFSIVVPMRCQSPYAGVIAANVATEIFLSKLAKFCVAKT